MPKIVSRWVDGEDTFRAISIQGDGTIPSSGELYFR